MLDPDDFGLDPIATLARVASPTLPEGFGRFWTYVANEISEETPQLIERTDADPSDASATHEFFGLGRARIGCGLFVPEGEILGGLVTLHGAGMPRPIDAERDRWRRLVSPGRNTSGPNTGSGVAVLAVRVRGFPGSMMGCPEFAGVPPEHWATVGLDAPIGDIRRGLDWSVVRAVCDVIDACRALRRWLDRRAGKEPGARTGGDRDGDAGRVSASVPLMLRGESLGGGLATIAAGVLAERFAHELSLDRLAIGLPTFGDWGFRARHPGYGQGRAIADVVTRAREHGPDVLERLRLSDTALHARRISCPVLAKLAVLDDVVPAPAAAAVFNALGTNGTERWRFVTPYGHHEGGIGFLRREAAFERCLMDFLNPTQRPRDTMRRWLPVLTAGDRPGPTSTGFGPSGTGDRSSHAAAMTATTSPAPAAGLFGVDADSADAGGLSGFDLAIIAEYKRVSRTLDDLPYTDAFESLYAAVGAESHNRTRREVFHRLHNLRKAGRLPRLGRDGRSGEERPRLSEDDERALIGLVERVAGSLGQRDRLPFTPEMDRLAERFTALTGHDLGLHELWRVIGKLAK